MEIVFANASESGLSAPPRSVLFCGRSHLIYVIIVMQFYSALRLNLSAPGCTYAVF